MADVVNVADSKDEIEITPEMIRAATIGLANYDPNWSIEDQAFDFCVALERARLRRANLASASKAGNI